MRDYGAKCDGSTDDGPAFNTAIAALRATGGIGAGSSPPHGTLSWAGCNAVIKTTLNFTALKSTAVTLNGQGGMLNGETAGKPVIDALGSENLRWHDISIFGLPGALMPSIGIQIGRLSASDAADNNHFENTSLNGYYGFAALYNFASETSHFSHLYVANNYAGSPLSCFGVVQDGSDHWAIGSQYASETATPDQLGSHDNNVFDLPIITTAGGCTPLFLSQSNGHSFIGGYAANFASASPSAPSGFIAVLWNPAPTTLAGQQAGANQFLDFRNMHMESYPTDLFYVTGPNTTPVMNGIHLDESVLQATNSIFKLDPAITAATLNDLDLRVGLSVTTGVQVFDAPGRWTVNGDVRLDGPGHWTTPPASFAGRLNQAGVVTETLADLSVGGSGPMAGAFTVSNPVPTAQTGTLGANATSTVRTKRLPGHTVAFNVQINVPNVGSGTGTVNLALPFTLAAGVTCFASGRELASNGKHVDFYIGGGASAGSMNYYDGSATLVAGQPVVIFVVNGVCETAN